MSPSLSTSSSSLSLNKRQNATSLWTVVTTACIPFASFVWLGTKQVIKKIDNVSDLIEFILVPLYTSLVMSYVTVQWFQKSKKSIGNDETKNDPPNDVITTKDRSLELQTTASSTTTTPSTTNGISTDSRTARSSSSSSSSSSSLQPITTINSENGEPTTFPITNLTGVYKLISNHNFEEILAVQGVPWALRTAANKARPTHRITHVGNSLTIKIEGIIESQTTYIVNGPKVQCVVRGRVFEDTVSYIPDGVQVMKFAVQEKYTIRVCRRLSSDKKQITLTSTAIFDNDNGKKPVESVQIFERIE